MEQQAISSDLIRGHIDTIILHTLLDGDKFAQQISDAVEEKSGKEYKINQATLYSSLKRLESLKHVTSYWNDSPSGRRKYFKLTDAGKNSVETNLSSWSYSRAIIDKLMDCAPTPIYQTKIVEKVVEVPVEVPVKIEQVIKTNDNLENPNKVQPVQIEDRNENKSDVQEVNFRNILNGLIKSSSSQKNETAPEIKDLEPIERTENVSEKQKFNETIDSTDYNAQKPSNTGKIDFGDLTIKAAKEGYKLRISSKDSASPSGNVFIGKINVCAALATYLIVMLEFLFFTLRFGSTLNAKPIVTILAVLALSIFPVLAVVKFFKNPNAKISGKLSPDALSNAAIIVFNLLFITLAVNLLVGVDFSNTYVILLSFVIPCVLFTDILLYYVIRFGISKTKLFNLKQKK